MRLLAYDTRLAELFDKDDQHYSSLQPGEALNRRLEQLRNGADAMQLDPVRRVESVKHRSIGLDYETDPVRARNDDLLCFIDTIEQKLAVTERVVQELRTRP